MNIVGFIPAVMAASSGGNPLGLIILLLPIGAIIFLTVVPQRRQRQKQAQLINELAVGDEVVTIGGIFGVINHLEDDVVHLEVDDDVVIRVGKPAVSRKAEEPEPSAPAARAARSRTARASRSGDTDDIDETDETDDIDEDD